MESSKYKTISPNTNARTKELIVSGGINIQITNKTIGKYLSNTLNNTNYLFFVYTFCII